MLEKKFINYVIVFASVGCFFGSLVAAGIFPYHAIFWAITGSATVFAISLYLLGLDPWDKINFFKGWLLSSRKEKGNV